MYNLTFKALFFCFLSFFVLSCSNDKTMMEDEYHEVIFDGNGLAPASFNVNKRKSISVFNTPVEIRWVSRNYSVEIAEAIDKLVELGVNMSDYDLTKMRLNSYKDTPTHALSIPKVGLLDVEELIVYISPGKTIFSIAKFDKAKNGEKTFSLTSLDSKIIHYSMNLGSDNKIKNLKVRKIPMVESSLTLASLKTSAALAQETCPNRTSNFSDCMLCAIHEECGTDWACQAACMAAPVACLIGFGLACGIG